MKSGQFEFSQKQLDIIKGSSRPVSILTYLTKEYGSSMAQYRAELLHSLWMTWVDDESFHQYDGIPLTPIDRIIKDQLKIITNEVYRLLRQHYHADVAETTYNKMTEVIKQISKGEIK